MKRLILACTLCLAFSQTWAQNAPKPAKFNFQGINVAQVLQLIYGEVLVSPYVIDPEVLTDARMVSFRYSNEKGDIRVFLTTFLDSLGYSVENKKGVDFITRTKLAEKIELAEENFVYRPLHRDTNYIARLLAPMFKGGFSVNNIPCKRLTR